MNDQPTSRQAGTPTVWYGTKFRGCPASHAAPVPATASPVSFGLTCAMVNHPARHGKPWSGELPDLSGQLSASAAQNSAWTFTILMS